MSVNSVTPFFQHHSFDPLYFPTPAAQADHEDTAEHIETHWVAKPTRVAKHTGSEVIIPTGLSVDFQPSGPGCKSTGTRESVGANPPQRSQHRKRSFRCPKR
ncbi:MAG: hypothetical protein CBB71_13695 [Rhodopirellula sp. TMED11]|nr:MAG: hypothetical protein CBB71_13695 [Rhodopirellula sp. TMED11]